MTNKHNFIFFKPLRVGPFARRTEQLFTKLNNKGYLEQPRDQHRALWLL